MLKFNLQNREFYGENYQSFLETKFKKKGLEFTKNKADVGHYSTSSLIGFGFPNSMFEKRSLHHLFKNECYYPNSMLITKKWATENKKKITEFINKKRKILKNNRGVSSEGIFIVDSYEEVMKIMNDKDFFILQEEIPPLLHYGKKMDERLYLFITKEDDIYSAFFMEESYFKFTRKNFEKEGLDKVSFVTNIKAPNLKKENFTISSLEFFKKYARTKIDILIEKRLDIMTNIAEKILPEIINKVKNHFTKTKPPKYMCNLYGIDLLFNENYDLYLCEINYKTGLPVKFNNELKKNEIDFKMVNRIFDCFFNNWIDNKNNDYLKDETIKRVAEISVQESGPQVYLQSISAPE